MRARLDIAVFLFGRHSKAASGLGRPLGYLTISHGGPVRSQPTGEQCRGFVAEPIDYTE